MSTITLTIKEAGNSFFLHATSTEDSRVVMSSQFDRDVPDNDPNSRELKLEGIRAYANGFADGLGYMRSILPTAHWSGRVETV